MTGIELNLNSAEALRTYIRQKPLPEKANTGGQPGISLAEARAHYGDKVTIANDAWREVAGEDGVLDETEQKRIEQTGTTAVPDSNLERLKLLYHTFLIATGSQMEWERFRANAEKAGIVGDKPVTFKMFRILLSQDRGGVVGVKPLPITEAAWRALTGLSDKANLDEVGFSLGQLIEAFQYFQDYSRATGLTWLYFISCEEIYKQLPGQKLLSALTAPTFDLQGFIDNFWSRFADDPNPETQKLRFQSWWESADNKAKERVLIGIFHLMFRAMEDRGVEPPRIEDPLVASRFAQTIFVRFLNTRELGVGIKADLAALEQADKTFAAARALFDGTAGALFDVTDPLHSGFDQAVTEIGQVLADKTLDKVAKQDRIREILKHLKATVIPSE